MKIFKILPVSIDCSTNFLIISLDSGVRPLPEPRKNAYFQNFLNFPINFRENIDKILKNRKFSCTIFNKLEIFIAFLTFFENFRVWKTRHFWFLRCKKEPSPIAPGTPPFRESCINNWLYIWWFHWCYTTTSPNFSYFRRISKDFPKNPCFFLRLHEGFIAN